jgi:hypothetical protein
LTSSSAAHGLSEEKLALSFFTFQEPTTMDVQIEGRIWIVATPALPAFVHVAKTIRQHLDDTDRGHGHAVYTQNQTGTKRRPFICPIGVARGGR